MASRPEGPIVLEVTFEAREDGGLRAYCDQVPGFILSHKNPEMVVADVEPALSTILSAMYGLPVTVQKAVTMREEIDVLPAYMCGAAQYVGLSNRS